MKTREHVIGLDVLRLLAATLVMFYHFGFWNWTQGQPFATGAPGHPPSFGASLHFGWIGVEVFFVISGYVIASSAAGVRPAAFLRNRFLRLAPASWLCATIVFVIWWSLGRPLGSLTLLYFQTLVFWPFNAIDGVWWTLGIEINFYFLVYILLRMDRFSAVEPVMVMIGAASGFFWVVASTLQSLLYEQTGVLGALYTLVVRAEGNRELQLLLVQHGCFFALGVVMWKATIAGITRQRAACIAALFGCCLLEIEGQNGIISRASQTDLPAWPALATWSVSVGLLCLSIVGNATLSRLLGGNTGLIRFAGLATYPLYLVHNAIGIVVIQAVGRITGMTLVFTGFVAAFACAAIIAGVLEPRLRNRLSALWPRSRAARPIDTAALAEE